MNHRAGPPGPTQAGQVGLRWARFERYRASGAEILRGFTPEQRSAYQRGRPRRLEEQIKPENVAQWRRALQKSLARVADRCAAGVVLARPTHEQGRAWDYRVQAILRARRQSDPAFDAAWRRATAPKHVRQPVEAYMEAMHSRNGFSRDRMPPDDAAAFDAAFRALLEPHAWEGIVEFDVVGAVLWGGRSTRRRYENWC